MGPMPCSPWKECQSIFVFSLYSDHASIDKLLFGHANDLYQGGLSICFESEIAVCAFGMLSPEGSCLQIGLRTGKADKA